MHKLNKSGVEYAKEMCGKNVRYKEVFTKVLTSNIIVVEDVDRGGGDVDISCYHYGDRIGVTIPKAMLTKLTPSEEEEARCKDRRERFFRGAEREANAFHEKRRKDTKPNIRYDEEEEVQVKDSYVSPLTGTIGSPAPINGVGTLAQQYSWRQR